MVLEKPHALLLDEPSKHLILETIDALATAIDEYKGDVIVVSHDVYTIERIKVDKVFKVSRGALTKLKSIDSYQKSFK